MKKLLSLTALSLLLLTSASAFAHPPRPGHPNNINARQHRQDVRIQQGIRSGQITPQEAKQLAGRERHINQVERAYRSDGHLTPKERARLQAMENRASKAIYQQKHDAQARP